MSKNSTFPNLLQKLISTEDIATAQEAVGYIDTARTLDVFTLIQYLVCASMNEFKSYRHCSEIGDQYALPNVDYSTLSKKATHMNSDILKKILHLVISKCNRSTRRSLNLKKELLIVDSTTITVGQTRLPWAAYHGKRSGIKLHVSYSPTTEMPFQVEESVGRVHDGPIGEKLLDPRFTMVEDRAYFKIKRIDRFVDDEQGFVIRMKENIEIYRPHALKRLKPSRSPVTRDITCQLGTLQSRSTKRHRVVFFNDDHGHEMRIVTNLMNVSAEDIADMYKTRWTIETFFRWMKQNLNVPKLFGTTPNAVYNQLFAAFISYVIIKWLYTKTSKGRLFSNLSFTAFQRKLLEGNLPIDWLSEMMLFLKNTFSDDRIPLSNYG